MSMSYPNSVDSADDIRTATDNFLEFVKLRKEFID